MTGAGPTWILYLIECDRGSRTVYYAGITTDMSRRFRQHADGTGARFTRANPPIRLVATREFPDRATASRAEAALKKLPRSRKPGFFG